MNYKTEFRLSDSVFNHIKKNFSKEIAALSPAYFAMSMATGIVSFAAKMSGFVAIANFLFYFNLFSFSILSLLFLIRLFFYYKSFRNDFVNATVSPGFLTIVAAIHVLGFQFISFQNNYSIATGLFIVGTLLWCFLIYSLFTIIIIRHEKDPLNRGINGIWLLIVVATESVSVLATELANHLPFHKEITLFFSLLIYLVGCMLYIILITLIFYRLAFFRVRPGDLAPAYWINMGAVAIITLAGTSLIQHSDEWIFLADLKYFMDGFTLLFWATGSWWIPLLIILGVWRYVFQKTKFIYKSSAWGMIFPLGMYTVCTYRLAETVQIHSLNLIPRFFVYIALFGWAITILGMLIYFLKLFKTKMTENDSNQIKNISESSEPQVPENH